MNVYKKDIQKIINDFLLIETWEERYEFLIFLGKKISNISKYIRKKNYMIIGCQSKIWICAYMRYNKLYFYADSDSILNRGIAAFLLSIYSDQYTYKVIHITSIFFSKINFYSFFTSKRANGLETLYKVINKYFIYFLY